jgi:indolepyruvate decarboxylase
MQLTAQELGTLLREGCAPVIVLLDNDGYTIERAIHGPERVYNDIARWNWTRLPAAMGGETMRAVQVSTPAELMAALDEAAAPAGRPVLIAAKLPKMDMPEYLLALARAAATANGIGQAA